MAWEYFEVENYKIYGLAHNTSGYVGIYGFIDLYWGERRRATLWFYRDGTLPILPNSSRGKGENKTYYGRFVQSQFADFIDILRNETPVYFHWSEEYKSFFLVTGKEPVGEEETVLPGMNPKMARNEETSEKVASIASKALQGKPITKKELRTLAGSALTQAPDKKK